MRERALRAKSGRWAGPQKLPMRQLNSLLGSDSLLGSESDPVCYSQEIWDSKGSKEKCYQPKVSSLSFGHSLSHSISTIWKLMIYFDLSSPLRPEQRKLDIMIGDFCKTELPFFDVCISNTPYQVSAQILTARAFRFNQNHMQNFNVKPTLQLLCLCLSPTPDLLPPSLQTPLPSTTFQMCNLNVSKRICSSTFSKTRFNSMV